MSRRREKAAGFQRRGVSGQLADPDIAEADGLAGVAVGLQLDGRAIVCLIERLADVEGLPFELEVVLHQHSVKEDGDIRRGFERSIGVEGGRGPDDVVGLPFAGLAVRIDQRRALFVDAAGLAVDIGFVVVGVEDLQLVSGVAGAGGGEKDAAVAARLAAAGDVLRDSPFDVELVIAEGVFGFDISGGLADGKDAVGDGPFGGGVILSGNPLVKIFAVEEDECVGGSRGVGGTGRDDGGDRLPDFRVLRFCSG
jgi:hypothetical protein